MATPSEGLDDAALADLRHRFEPSVRTHWDDCYKDHAFCAVVRLCDELTAARQRIAEQDAQLAAIRVTAAATHEATERLGAQLAERTRRIAALETAASRQQEEISQTLGRALGYPRLADDPTNFPAATEVDGVCVGDHVAESLAAEAAHRLAALDAALALYGTHVPGCRRNADTPCTCGLDAAHIPATPAAREGAE